MKWYTFSKILRHSIAFPCILYVHKINKLFCANNLENIVSRIFKSFNKFYQIGQMHPFFPKLFLVQCSNFKWLVRDNGAINLIVFNSGIKIYLKLSLEALKSSHLLLWKASIIENCQGTAGKTRAKYPFFPDADSRNTI